MPELTPKLLLAETAKFFKEHPQRFIRGSLSSAGRSVSSATYESCFCTVGYMAYRLRQNGYDIHDPYGAVGNFFGGKYGMSASQLVGRNDDANHPEEVVEFLIQEAKNA